MIHDLNWGCPLCTTLITTLVSRENSMIDTCTLHKGIVIAHLREHGVDDTNQYVQGLDYEPTLGEALWGVYEDYLLHIWDILPSPIKNQLIKFAEWHDRMWQKIERKKQ